MNNEQSMSFSYGTVGVSVGCVHVLPQRRNDAKLALRLACFSANSLRLGVLAVKSPGTQHQHTRHNPSDQELSSTHALLKKLNVERLTKRH